ncbi:hypothetical protein [Granulicella mallensis]|uniref:hypothetical protein n=1 Tax=Granulicella mallensis TaxID=940614 RepID=UPI000305E4AD|nr:hypothetical protein [Granulicella mallensis]
MDLLWFLRLWSPLSLLFWLLPFLLVIPTLSEAEGERTCFLPFFVRAVTNAVCQDSLFWLYRYFLGGITEKRETAGSLPFGFAQGRNDKPERQEQPQKQKQSTHLTSFSSALTFHQSVI